MGLTLTEKEHFTKRLKERAEEARERIQGSDLTWRNDVRKAAEAEIRRQVGCDELIAERTKLEEQRDALNNQIAGINLRIAGLVEGLSPENASTEDGYRYGHRETDFGAFPEAVRARVRALVKMAQNRGKLEHPIGRIIAQIDENERNYHDEIMACSTHAQLQTLWAEITKNIASVRDQPDREARKVSTTRNRKK